MTHTYKTLLLATAAVLTISAGGAFANDYPATSSSERGATGTEQTESNSNYQTPSSPDTAEIGGQQDEYAPSERQAQTDALGKSNDGTQDVSSAQSDNVNREDIATVQEKLKEEGFDVSVDGVMGNQTRDALRSYQSANNLSPTGTLNDETIESLRVSSR